MSATRYDNKDTTRPFFLRMREKCEFINELLMVSEMYDDYVTRIQFNSIHNARSAIRATRVTK
jgi:hypothetical protein